VSQIRRVSDGELAGYSSDPNVPVLYAPYADGSVLISGGTVYVVTDGKRRGIATQRHL
jgi:hypothetical protein